MSAPSKMKVPFFSLDRHVSELREDALEAVDGVLRSQAFANGPQVARFEEELAGFLEVSRVVCVNSGTSALHAALICAGVEPGSEVVTVAHTWISTVWAISYVGAVPRLVDVEERTCGMDPERLEAAVTANTRAIVPVHLYGQPVDLAPILEIGRRRGVPVIEDAAQALGARYAERRVGSFGRVGATSFYPAKNLGAFGEGGAVITDDHRLADRAVRLRDHAQDGRHNHVELGFNWRMDGIQAAVLSLKLERLEGWNHRRREIAERYARSFGDLPGIRTMGGLPGSDPVWHIFPIFHPRRDALRSALERAGVGTAVHYPRPVHLQPAYRSLGLGRGDLPVSEQLADTELSLPMFPEMTDEEVEYVVAAVAEACRSLR